jgi:hypothetical protein
MIFCDAVLKTRAFDYYVCKTNLSNISVTENQSQSFGGSGSYAEIYKGFFHTAKSLDVSSNDMITSAPRRTRLLSALFSTTHSQFAGRAVKAWEIALQTQPGDPLQ